MEQYIGQVKSRNVGILPRSHTKKIKFIKKIKLTQIKQQIIEFLRKGYSAKVIAIQLDRSPRTIEMHIDHMYQVCNIHSRKEFLDLIHQGAHKQFFIEE